MKKVKHSKLMEYVKRSDERFRRLQAEQRSNILLNAGDHYSKKSSSSFSRLREFRDLNEEQKLRITANHSQVIMKIYKNGILSLAPGVTPVPKNPKELEDKKAAEMNKAVWKDIVSTHALEQDIQDWVDDYTVIGECAVLLRFNPNIGKLVGMKQALDKEGNPAFKEDGEMKASDEGEMSGDLEFVTIYASNLIFPDGALSFKKSPWVGVKELISNEDIEAWLENYPEKKELFKTHKKENQGSGQAETQFYTFNHNSFDYEYQRGHSLVYSHFYRPCQKYPEGYFYIFTEDMILFQGKLPFGIFPLYYVGFDRIQSSPRHRSVMKTLRPFQVEINRGLSKMAEHQITIGDDKVFLQSGTRLQNSVTEPGIRAFTITGKEPQVVQGRVGDQYLSTIQFVIENMYKSVQLDSALQKGANIGGDGGFGFLFMSMAQKKPFLPYAKKFELFLCEICEGALNLARHYYDEDKIIKAVGMDEAVNIEEFKKTTDLSYHIEVEPLSSDLESLFGKQLAINHALQYTGSNLPPEEIGKFIKNMPFANFEDNFKSLTLNEDSANNLILALERGEKPEPSKYDDHVFMVNKLVARVRDASFKLLDPQIQQAFFEYIQGFEQLEAQKQQELKAMQDQFIPVDSHLVKVNIRVPKKGSKNPNATENAELPYSALLDLMQKLEKQGYSQERLKSMNQGAQADIASMIAPSQMLQQQQQGGIPDGQQIPKQGLVPNESGNAPIPNESGNTPMVPMQGLLKGF